MGMAQTSRVWMSLPNSVFPFKYDLQSLKKRLNDLIVTDLQYLDRTRPD